MTLCFLYDKECVNCGECQFCDIDPTKKCDNCCKCIDDEDIAFKSVYIDSIVTEDEI